jgi:hypothetical protein
MWFWILGDRRPNITKPFIISLFRRQWMMHQQDAINKEITLITSKYILSSTWFEDSTSDCSGSRSYGMWRHVGEWYFPDASKQPTAAIFMVTANQGVVNWRLRHCVSSKRREQLSNHMAQNPEDLFRQYEHRFAIENILQRCVIFSV